MADEFGVFVKRGDEIDFHGSWDNQEAARSKAQDLANLHNLPVHVYKMDGLRVLFTILPGQENSPTPE